MQLRQKFIIWRGLFTARSQILERRLSELCPGLVRTSSVPASLSAIVCIHATCLFIILSQITKDLSVHFMLERHSNYNRDTFLKDLNCVVCELLLCFKFQKCFIEHCIYNINIKSICIKNMKTVKM